MAQSRERALALRRRIVRWFREEDPCAASATATKEAVDLAMNRTTNTATTLLGACVLAFATLAGGAAGARQLATTDPPPPADPLSPARGHAEVIATWLVEFADGPYEWNVSEHTVDAAGIDLAHSAPTFLISDGDFSTVITGPEARARLADGEALFRRPTLTTHAAAVGAEPATLLEWTISTSPTDDDDGPSSDPIEPGAGTHDVKIIRDRLPSGETFTLRAGIPAFVMVTSGWVTTTDGSRIDAGGWVTLRGDVVLTNGGEEPAVLVAAWISPVLDLTQGAATTSTTPAAPTTSPRTTPPAPTAEPAATIAPPSEVTTTTAEETTTTPPAPETTEAPTTTEPVGTTEPGPIITLPAITLPAITLA